MLILISDGGPCELYTRLQYEIWRQYMHLRPNQVEAYFYKANPNIDKSYIDGDTVYVKCKEEYPNLWKKWWLTLQVFEHRLDEYDFIYRPNSSSFTILDRLIQYVEDKPRTKFCGGHGFNGPYDSSRTYQFPTGYGFIITIDIAKYCIINDIIPDNEGIDDYLMGDILKHMAIDITYMPYCVIGMEREPNYKELLKIYTSQEFIYIRIKFGNSGPIEKKIIDWPQKTIDMHYMLLDAFYPNHE